MKYVSIILVILLIAGGIYWYGTYAGWFFPGPDNLPTAEEWDRIHEVERTSSQTDPNAKAGVGVAPRGTLPPSPPVEQTTSTSSTTDATSTEGVLPDEDTDTNEEAEENV